jgi:hypothetical protein
MNLNNMIAITMIPEIDWVIDSMQLKLDEAKRKKPNNDYTEPERKIDILTRLKKIYYECEYENVVLDKKIRQEFAINQQLRINIDKLKVMLKEKGVDKEALKYLKNA